jgi:putative endonuclease
MEVHVKSVYILRSSLRRRPNYVGITVDFERRLSEHNANHSPPPSPAERGLWRTSRNPAERRYTSGGAPWTPVVVVRFEDDRKAERFEAYLKTGSGRAFAKRHFL